MTETVSCSEGQAVQAKTDDAATESVDGQKCEDKRSNAKIRFCYKCGSKLVDGSRFCSICGTMIPRKE